MLLQIIFCLRATSRHIIFCLCARSNLLHQSPRRQVSEDRGHLRTSEGVPPVRVGAARALARELRPAMGNLGSTACGCGEEDSRRGRRVTVEGQESPFAGKVLPAVWPLTEEYQNRRGLAKSPVLGSTSSSSPWASAPPALRVLHLRPNPGPTRSSSSVGLGAVAPPNGPIPNPDRDANAHCSSVEFDDTEASAVQQRTVSSPFSPPQDFVGRADSPAPQVQHMHSVHLRGHPGSSPHGTRVGEVEQSKRSSCVARTDPVLDVAQACKTLNLLRPTPVARAAELPFTPRKLALAQSLLERPATQLQSIALEAL